jgi:hypothetical protein
MNLFSTLFSTIILAVKRLWNHRLLMLCLLVGLAVAVALLSSIPLYADAAQHQLLQGELTEAGTFRPPFSFLWRYVGTWHGDVAWDDYLPGDEYLSQQAADAVGLPLDAAVRHVQTANLRLFPAGDDSGFVADEPLLWTTVGFISGLEQQVQVVEGEFPPFTSPPLGGTEARCWPTDWACRLASATRFSAAGAMPHRFRPRSWGPGGRGTGWPPFGFTSPAPLMRCC